jgi:hypothetical protein
MQGAYGSRDSAGRGRGGGGLVTALALAGLTAVAGLAVDHAQALEEDRESIVQGAFRRLTDFMGVPADSGPSRRGGNTVGGGPRRAPVGLSREELDALPVRVYRARDAERAEEQNREGGGGESGKQMCASTFSCVFLHHCLTLVQFTELTGIPARRKLHALCLCA